MRKRTMIIPLLSLCPLLGYAQTTPTTAQSPESNEALITRVADDVWNQGKLEVIDEIMAPHGKYHGPHMPAGKGDREAWREAIRRYRSSFPDAHVTFEALIPAGDVIVGRWIGTGTHTGPMPGLPPTGTPITISGITIYRFENGQVVEAWEELDLLGMWRQLGVVKVPGPNTNGLHLTPH